MIVFFFLFSAFSSYADSSSAHKERAHSYVMELSEQKEINKDVVLSWGKGVSKKDDVLAMSKIDSSFAFFYVNFLWMSHDKKQMLSHIDIIKSQHPSEYKKFCFKLFESFETEEFEKNKLSETRINEIDKTISECLKNKTVDFSELTVFKMALMNSFDEPVAKKRYQDFIKKNRKEIPAKIYEQYLKY